MLHKKLEIFKKKDYDLFHFNLSIVSFHANLKFLQYFCSFCSIFAVINRVNINLYVFIPTYFYMEVAMYEYRILQ